MTSAYPLPTEQLVDRVRELAAELGELPSRNRVMKTFRVGSPKATAALDALRGEGRAPVPAPSPAPIETTGSGCGSEPGLGPTLRVVPDPDPGPADAASGGPQIDADTIIEAGLDGVAAGSEADRVPGVSVEVTSDGHPPAEAEPGHLSRAPRWLVLLIALPAFVAIWSGWVGLGELTGFGPVALLPGIAEEFVINSAITLPIGVEAYAALAMWVWLGPGRVVDQARRFARWSAIGSLALGGAGQVAYHLMVAAGMSQAPWQITAFVACLPVVVLGCAAALLHLTHHNGEA